MAFKTICSVLGLLSVAAITEASQFASQVQVVWYSFNGTELTGSMVVQNLAPQKAIKVVYADKSQNWDNKCDAHYTSGPGESQYELWSINCPIKSNGISQFYVEYDVNGQTYIDNNGGYGVNYQVTQQ